MKRFLYITCCLAVLILTGCKGSNGSSSSTSSVARLSALTFAANDSMPGLAAAVFTIDERIDTGLVWNKDSMLYGTELTRVVPRFTFAATPSAAWLKFSDTICYLTGYDTLDFTKQPIYLSIRSYDRSNTKTYEIRPSVHQADPDLYTWTQLSDGIYPQDESEQRALELNNTFVLVKSNGFALHAYQSADGSDWTDLGEPNGLPTGTKVRQIISDGQTLYYGQDNYLYTSSDAVTWTPVQTTYPVITMLLHWNDRVWALVENNGYELAYIEADSLALSGLRPQGDFPISDFATVCFHNASLRARAMIIGGFAENGKSLNTRWNLEYSTHPLPNGTYRMEEFSIDRPTFTSMTGISVIWYNNQLMLFGGVDADMQYFGRDILVSTNEGLSWTAADTTKNQLPEVYQARQKQTAIVRDNDIYLFGGVYGATTYSDVYKGRLNSIDWDK